MSSLSLDDLDSEKNNFILKVVQVKERILTAFSMVSL